MHSNCTPHTSAPQRSSLILVADSEATVFDFLRLCLAVLEFLLHYMCYECLENVVIECITSQFTRLTFLSVYHVQPRRLHIALRIKSHYSDNDISQTDWLPTFLTKVFVCPARIFSQFCLVVGPPELPSTVIRQPSSATANLKSLLSSRHHFVSRDLEWW